jgi:MFS family permease
VLAAASLSTSGPVRLALALLGVGIGLAAPAAQNAALSAVAPERSGVAAGMSSTMRYLGGIIGIAILGRLLDLRGNRDAIIYDHRTILAVFAATLLAGLVCAALLPGRGVRRAPSELSASTRGPTPDGPKSS